MAMGSTSYRDFFDYVELHEKPKTVGQNLERLSLEIWTKFQQNQQNLPMFNRKLAIYDAISAKLKGSGYSVEIMGSTLSGSGTNSSDLDLVLLSTRYGKPTGFGPLSHDGTIQMLHGISPLLSGIGSPSKSVLNAKTPILQFTENSIDVDISVGLNLDGIRKTYLLWAYCKLNPRVRPLIIIVKLWAKHHGINNPNEHSLSGYALALMVIFYLQQGSAKILPNGRQLLCSCYNHFLTCSFADELKPMAQRAADLNRYSKSRLIGLASSSLGELLTGFLKYYSTFNFDGYGISVLSGQLESKRSMTVEPTNEWKCICIKDPFDSSNASKSVHDLTVFARIKNVFKNSYERISKEQRLNSILN